MVQDQKQGRGEAHMTHQEARVSKDYGSGARGRSLPTAMVVLPTGSLRCREEWSCRLIEHGRFCVLQPLLQQRGPHLCVFMSVLSSRHRYLPQATWLTLSVSLVLLLPAYIHLTDGGIRQGEGS